MFGSHNSEVASAASANSIPFLKNKLLSMLIIYIYGAKFIAMKNPAFWDVPIYIAVPFH